MATEEQQTELSWEEAVGRFLQDNPDYLDRHPHLLRRLDIPHADTGKAVSLIERQVGALRKDNLALEAQLRQLVHNATGNDALAGQLHRFTIDLMLAPDLPTIIELATNGLRDRFGLEQATLKLFAGDGQEGEVFVSADDALIKQVSAQVQQGKTACGLRLGEEEVKALLGEAEAPAGSIALIPVRSATLLGLLLIGSSDSKRFVAGMATTYLDRIGELLAVAVSRQPEFQSK